MWRHIAVEQGLKLSLVHHAGIRWTGGIFPGILYLRTRWNVRSAMRPEHFSFEERKRYPSHLSLNGAQNRSVLCALPCWKSNRGRPAYDLVTLPRWYHRMEKEIEEKWQIDLKKYERKVRKEEYLEGNTNKAEKEIFRRRFYWKGNKYPEELTRCGHLCSASCSPPVAVSLTIGPRSHF